MSDGKPLISIGMPVYNGETHLCQALDSLLTQSYENLEVYICDNASTDRTGEICRSYRSIDKRVHYHYQPNHVGVLANYQRVLNLTSSEYFMWAAADDCWRDRRQHWRQAAPSISMEKGTGGRPTRTTLRPVIPATE